jgi:hypothetical protein
MGSHVYEINTWMWNFGRPHLQVGDLSAAKRERICRQSRSETSRGTGETRKAGASNSPFLDWVTQLWINPIDAQWVVQPVGWAPVHKWNGPLRKGPPVSLIQQHTRRPV